MTKRIADMTTERREIVRQQNIRGLRRHYAKHKKQVLSRQKELRKTPARRAVRRAWMRGYYRLNATAFRARANLNYALRTGNILRLPCEFCGEGKTHGHHKDYSRPLDVMWLCGPCHRKVHSLAALKVVEGK